MSSALRFVFTDARIWRYILRVLADYLETIGIKISPSEGVRIRAMDPSRVMLLDFSIPTTAFEEYIVGKEEILFLNLESVSKILRRAMKMDKFALLSNGTKLAIALISKGGTQRSFTLPLISSTYEEIPELSLEFKVIAKVIGPIFATTISVLEEVGEAVRFRALREGLSISSPSELGEIEFLFTTTSGTLIDYQIIDDIQEFSNAYSMEYVSMLSQLSKLAETVSIKLAPEAPCEIALDMANGVQLKVYIAPRIE
jgi:proliferating cell nuclear antigen